MKIWFLFSFAFLFLFGGAVAAPQAVIEFFSPEGTVKKVNQVTVRFSDDMIAFGDPKQPSPFDVKCPEKGSERWIDTKNWAFEFGKDLPAGIRCEFTAKPGLKTLKGKVVAGRLNYAFSTGGPAIVNSRPYEGSNYVNEDQVFVLILDSEVDESSVLANAYFAVEGIKERVGVQLIKGKDRERIRRSEYISKEELPRTVMLQAKQVFPTKGKTSLVWGKGIKSSTGVPTDADQVLPFEVRKAFIAEFSCERENEKAACIPFSRMALNFSAPIATSDLAKIVMKSGNKTWKPEITKNSDGLSSYADFKGPFPDKTTFTLEIPKGLVDDSGRKLSNADKFPLKIATDKFPPLAKFSGSFGVLELKGNPQLPVTVRNLEKDVQTRLMKIDKSDAEKVKQYETIKGKKLKVALGSEVRAWLKRVDRAQREHSVFDGAPSHPKTTEFALPGRTGTETFEVIGIPIQEPGLYVVELESAKLGKSLLEKKGKMYVPTAVLVTNLAVHFKWGRESSLAWVTQLDNGKAAKDAKVEVRDCTNKVLWSGTTDGDGVARIENMAEKSTIASCESNDYSNLNQGLLVTAVVDNDMSFTHTSWNNGIEYWRYQVSSENSDAPNLAHTVFDRTLLRAGDTVHMKHFIRRHARAGFAHMPASERPNTIVIEHSGSDQKYRFPLKFDNNGVAESKWAIPKEAKLGTYSTRLVKDAGKKKNKYSYEPGWNSGSFRVEEFRVPLMKAVVKGPGEALVRPSETTVDLSVSYLAGGGASKMPVKVRHQVQNMAILSFDDFDGFTFSNGNWKEGKKRTEAGDEDETPAEDKPNQVQSQEVVLDKAGTAKATLKKLPKMETPYQILAEMEFNDPNGETQTVASFIPVYPAKQLVGIKLDSWAGSKDDLKFHVSVVNAKGEPVAKAPVKVALLERKTYSHRKRIVGGYYSYEHFEEVNKLADFCEGQTDAKGLVVCQAKSPASGNLIVQAWTKDPSGNENYANREVWVAGDGEWWFDVADHDRMDVLAEKPRYEPGDTAKFQVRMPFRDATALIAVEREGVMDVYVRDLSGKSPFVEIPVKPNYAPNVYVSVLAVRGRVGDVQPTAIVDLGRPSFKLGIGQIKVGWKNHELKVKVTSDKSTYQVRQKAKVNIKVTGPDGKNVSGGEVALAAVDEGLLELHQNTSWKLLDGMMGFRGYAVENSTAQMHVVGKRHFGVKALAAGGGGGADQPTRELFDTLLLWKGKVGLNKDGEASVDVPLNDSITSFKIVAIGSSGVDKFGTGSTSIRATQDLMLFSGIPPLVREGDKFRAMFTLRNTTDKPMDVSTSLTVTPDAMKFPDQKTPLAPGESKEIAWEVTAPINVQELVYELEAKDTSGKRDKMKVKQKVIAAIPVRTFQATVAQLDGKMELPVERPADAIPGRGSINVGLKPSLLSGMDGIREYMSQYPYNCLEQKVSRAVALRDKKAWKEIMAELPGYLDYYGLAKYFPIMQSGSDSLTAYLLAIADEANWEIPKESSERMVTALKGFVEGTVRVNSTMPTSDLAIRKIMAIEALSRSGNRTVDPKWLTAFAIEPNLWPTSAVMDYFLVLRRGYQIPDRDAKLKQTETILRSRINLQGTNMAFSNESVDSLWWLMISGDRNAVRMILAVMDLPQWKDDMPRLVKGALGRQHKGHWDLTTANAWGVLALEKFAANFEKTPVSGVTKGVLATQDQSVDWKAIPPGKVLSFNWPDKRDQLKVSHEGAGKPWIVFQALAAIPLKAPLWAGYRIQKTVTPIEQKESGKWSRGDMARVRLSLSGDADMTWVVVNDPIPAGASILGSGLGRDSHLATQGEKKGGEKGNWVFAAFEERTFDSFRSYYDYVNKGEWVTEYSVRLNNGGTFQLPTTRVEAMYSPEMFGELPNANWEVKP